MNKRNFFLLLVATLPFWLNFAIFFLKDPPVFPDEVIFSSLAKNLIENGTTKTNLLGGILPEVDQSWLNYRLSLYFHLLGRWGEIFGDSIESIRSLSLLAGFFSLTTFFFICRLIFHQNRLAFEGTFLLSINVIFGRASRLARMEIFTLLFLLVSLFFLLLAFKQPKKIFLISAAFSASLSSMTHPIGLISLLILVLAILASSGFHFSQTKISKLILVAETIFLTYLSWIVLNGENLWSLLSTYQTHLQDKITPKITFAWLLFSNDLSWRFLFLVYLAIAFSFFLFFVRTKGKKYFLIMISLIISVGAAILAKESSYLIYFQPFVILALLVLVEKYFQSDFSIWKKVPLLLTILFIISHLNIQFFHNDNLGINNNWQKSSWASLKNDDYQKFSNLLAAKLPQDKKATVFISAVPDPYFGLKNQSNLIFYETVDPSVLIPDSAYKQLLDLVDYLIITWSPHLYLTSYINQNTESFRKISQDNGYQATLIKLKPKDKRI